MYDVAIIGTGAAGISAALTLKARNKNFIWFGSAQFSQKIRSAEKIQNYPGLPMTSGEEMAEIFKKQIDDIGISVTDKTVTGVYPMNGHYAILCDQESFESYTVIICTGVAAVKPIPGELEFVGKGLSYCATCDGFLYKGKSIAVECTSKDLEPEIIYLAESASKVYLMPLYKNPEVSGDNIEIIKDMPREIVGDKRVEKVVFDSREITVDGVFMLKESVSPDVLIRGIDTAGGHIAVDRMCRTNLDGCYAAGDCTGRPFQYTKAVGEGNIAAHSAIEYLAAHGLKSNLQEDKNIDLDIPNSREYLNHLINKVDITRLPSDESIDRTVLTRLTKGALDLVPVGNDVGAENGNVVTFSISGGEGRFSGNNLRLTLGQGMYDSEVEALMLGKKAGDVYDVAVKGKSLCIKILDICRKEVPSVNDETVKAEQIEGVNTLAEYHDKVKDELITTEIYNITGEIIGQLMDNAPEEELNEKVIEQLEKLELEFFDNQFKKEKGKGIYEMSPDELKEELGCETISEFLEARNDWYKIKVKQCKAIADALELELAGDYDMLSDYTVLGRLQMELVNTIKSALMGRAQK